MDDSMTTGWDALDESHQVLRETVAALRPTDLDRATPCDQWTVTQVLQHAAGDQVAYASRITGGPGPLENPFTPSGRLDDSATTLVALALQSASAAWRTVRHDQDDVPTPLPQGVLPARIAAGACALDAAVHAWDVAVATGQQPPLTESLARELLPVAQSIVEPLRAYGAYAPALDAVSGDDDVALLLRYLGRRPEWVAPPAAGPIR